MTHSIEIPLLSQTKKDQIEEERKMDHLIEIKETNGQDRSGLQTNKFANQFFEKKFKDLNNSSINTTTIFRVTMALSESNPDAYKPKLISIGPYHNKNPELRSMEKYKLMYLQRFLRRKEGIDLESCISELEERKDDALKCYDDIGDLGSYILVNFLEIMLLDGCFVVEYIRERCKMMPEGEDEIIKGGCIKKQVRRDLLLVENQLPFFVLTKLHDMSKEVDKAPPFIEMVKRTLFLDNSPIPFQESDFKQGSSLKIAPHPPFQETEVNEVPFIEMVKRTFCLAKSRKMTFATSFLETKGSEESSPKMTPATSFQETEFNGLPLTIRPPFEDPEENMKQNIKHLFHAVHMYMSCHPSKNMPRDTDHMMWHKVMPNATELSEAGVSFANVGNIFRSLDKDNNLGDSKSLFDIKFENGLITIPCFQVAHNTETLLRNLIAYEQQSSDVCLKYFSDFAIFMDCLIDSDKDVNLLRHKGIIVNKIGEDKEVASFFNKIGKGVVVSPNFIYKGECRKAFQHCEKPWNRMKANLRHNYFPSPWVGASTVAAIILLLLTAIQTILAFTGPVKK